MNYETFSNMASGGTITLKEFHEIYNGCSTATIKDNCIRGAKTVCVNNVKIGDLVNNGTRFIEIV